jgi:hypothetical protein
LNKAIAYKIFILTLLILTVSTTWSQDDSTRRADSTKRMIPVDSLPIIATPFSNQRKIDSVLKNHSPRKAAIRSALIPGWGQIYNKKYWKLPIVYGDLGVSGYVFVFNFTNYRELRDAYRDGFAAVPKRDPSTGAVIPNSADSSGYNKLTPFLQRVDLNALRSYRDEFRRNIDYSALAFIVLWGLNVVDATVDAHLKTFDVSPDLSFRFKIGHSELAGTNGISLVLALK